MISLLKKLLYKHCWHYRFLADKKADYIEFNNGYDSSPYPKQPGNDVIMMFSGRVSLWAFDLHGGLADRLKGIVSVYKACIEANRTFKILHTIPYKLEDYLEPNEIDWRIKEDEIQYNRNAVHPHYLRHAHYKDEEKYLMWRLIKLLKSEKGIHHIYSNAKMINDEEYRDLFHKLFKPSPVIQSHITNNLQNINNIYISLSFRFCHLLGDPIDEYMPELNQNDKISLLNKTYNSIIDFHQSYPNHTILINSDSATFIDYIKKKELNYVHIIPGIPIHIDQVKVNELNTIDSYIKTFVDFFMISKAEKVFLVKSTEMRNSGFPKVASIIGNKPFQIHHI